MTYYTSKWIMFKINQCGDVAINYFSFFIIR
jgi:hypothetical protein